MNAAQDIVVASHAVVTRKRARAGSDAGGEPQASLSASRVRDQVVGHKRRRDVVWREGALPKLAALLRRAVSEGGCAAATQDEAVAALGALGSFARGSSAMVQELVGSGAPELAVEALQARVPALVVAALRFLEAVATHALPWCPTLPRSAIKTMLARLWSQDVGVARAAARAVGRWSFHVTTRASLMQCGALEALAAAAVAQEARAAQAQAGSAAQDAAALALAELVCAGCASWPGQPPQRAGELLLQVARLCAAALHDALPFRRSASAVCAVVALAPFLHGVNEARFSDEPEGEGFQPVIHASVAEHVHPPCCLTLDMLPEPARRGAAMCLDAALPALLALVSALATDAKALAAHASPADALHSPLLAATGAPQAVALSRLWLHCHAMGALHVLVGLLASQASLLSQLLRGDTWTRAAADGALAASLGPGVAPAALTMALTHCISALACLCGTGAGTAREVAKPRVLEALLDALESEDEQLRCAACTCLWELSSQWRTVRWSLVEARVVPALLRLMSDARQLGSRAGEAACGDGSESDSGSGGCCVGDERETEEHADAGDAAVATLANLLQGSPPAKQEVVAFGGVEALAAQVETATARRRSLAAQALQYLFRGAEEDTTRLARSRLPLWRVLGFLPGASDAVRVSVWALMCLLMTDSATDLQLDPELIASILRSARVELRSPCERAHTQVLYLLTFMVMEHGPALTHLAGDAALLRTLPDALRASDARKQLAALWLVINMTRGLELPLVPTAAVAASLQAARALKELGVEKLLESLSVHELPSIRERADLAAHLLTMRE